MECLSASRIVWNQPLMPRTSMLLLYFCLAFPCAAPLVAADPGAPLVFEPYAFETQDHGTIAAEVAFLEVPRRHAIEDAQRMLLRVVRLRATGGGGRGAPVVYLAGGPGGSGVGTARGPRWPVFDRVRRETDILLLDQRGTGLSEPPPPCPYSHHFDDAQPLERTTALAALRETAARCIAYWRQAGIDLAAYTSLESAHDIEHLRRALGVPRISLWGMSYGTHLALASVRLHGASIDRVVLMGAEGPDDTLKFPLSADALFKALSVAAKDGGFDMAASAERVFEALDKQPRQGRSLMHGGRQVTIGKYDAQLATSTALGRRSTQQILPLALQDAAQGDYDMLAGVVIAVREQLGEFRAMPLAMEVASGHSPRRLDLVEVQAHQSMFADALNFPFPMIAEGLGLADLGEAFRAPLHTDVPALFVSGTLDGRTPPTNAEALLPGFPRGMHQLVHGASHDDELWLGNPLVAERIAGFLAGRQTDVNMLEVAPPRFPTGKIDALLQVLGISRSAALSGLLLALTLPLIMLLLWRRWRRSRLQPTRQSPE